MKKILVTICLLLGTCLSVWLANEWREKWFVLRSESGPVLSMPKDEEKEATLLAVGDIMLARKVEKLMQAKGDGYPFELVKEEIRKADIAFANLESPLSARGQALPGKGICFRARPEMAEVLKKAGFDVLSVANNHALDYDSEAFLDTLYHLRRNGIEPVGGGENIEQARKPVIVECQGMKVGFLAYTIFADLYYHPQYRRPFRASENRCGVAPLVENIMLEDIEGLRPRVDVVVVSLHWGTEYMDTPSEEQVNIAHSLVDRGADIVIGHHPHIMQGVEVYRGKVIAYSLGNFIFDQNQHLFTRQGVMFKVRLTPDGWEKITLLPVFIDQSQPALMGKEGYVVLEKLKNLSGRLGTEAEIKGDRLEILPADNKEETS